MNTIFIDAMKKKGYSRKTLSLKLGVSTEHIRMIQIGKRRPSPDLAKKIEKELGIKWTFFFET